MSATDTAMGLFDLEITLALITLDGARAVCNRCPSTVNTRRVAEAEAELNRLLDHRLTAA